MSAPRRARLATLLLGSLLGAAGAGVDARWGRAQTAGEEPEVLPELLAAPPARYPPAALRAGREGAVLLELLVSASGGVDSLQVLEAPDSALGAAAAAAAAAFRFSPARAGGEAVPVYLRYRYSFSLSEGEQALPAPVVLRGQLKVPGGGPAPAGTRVWASLPAAPADSLLPLPWPRYRAWLGRLPGQQLEGDGLGTEVDADGVFALRALPPGPLTLLISASGFDSHRLASSVVAGAQRWLALSLRPTPAAAYEMLVIGESASGELTQQRLSAFEVERLPGLGGDAVRSLQALPGIARPQLTDPGAVIVRGASGGDSRFLLDGVDIPLLFHYGGVKSTYNSLALGSVDLYPGGYGSRYGACVGGVVELRGRPARADRWRRALDASALDVSLHAEGPLGARGGLLLTARRSFAGELLTALLAGRDDIDLALAPYYWDGVLRLDWRTRRGDALFLTAFAAQDRMGLIFPEEERGSAAVNAATDAVDLNLRFGRLIFGQDLRRGNGLENSLRAAWGRSLERGHVFGYYDFDLRGPYYKLRDELTLRAGAPLALRLGVDLTEAPLRYRVRALGWPVSAQDKGSSALAGYGALDWRPRSGLLLSPGIRYDYYRRLATGVTSLRLGARWSLGAAHTVTAAFGTYNQPPQPLTQSVDPIYGNPRLPPTLASHFTLGDEWRLGGALSLKVEGYFNTQRRIPALTDSLRLNYLAEAEGRMAGLELMLRREVGERFFGWLSYSLSRSERRYPRPPRNIAQDPGFDNQPSIAVPWDPERWVPFELDQTHHLEAVGSWRLGRAWSLGTRLQFVSGNPVTPLLSLEAGQFEFDADTGNYQQVAGDYLADRLWPYFRCDLRLDKRFTRRRSEWSLYLDVQNLNYFVYNSPEGYGYNFDFSKRREYGWIILPALGCRVEF
ncbi:TonB family protein [bacterium]|nr:TonB family protein [bacterium]